MGGLTSQERYANDKLRYWIVSCRFSHSERTLIQEYAAEHKMSHADAIRTLIKASLFHTKRGKW